MKFAGTEHTSQVIALLINNAGINVKTESGVGGGGVRAKVQHLILYLQRPDCQLNTGKNNSFPFLDILGHLKNTHKNPKFGGVRQVPIRELGSSSSIFIYTRNRIILHGLPRNRV